jgi:hypothetical protein
MRRTLTLACVLFVGIASPVRADTCGDLRLQLFGKLQKDTAELDHETDRLREMGKESAINNNAVFCSAAKTLRIEANKILHEIHLHPATYEKCLNLKEAREALLETIQGTREGDKLMECQQRHN